MNNIAKRLTSIIMAFVIVAMEFSAIGLYAISYATNGENTQLANDKISYGVYFEDGSTETTEDINSEGFKLYMKIRVLEPGYLKNATIEFGGPSGNSNFLIDNNYKSEYVQEIEEHKDENPSQYTYRQTVKLEQINSGEEITIELPVKPKRFDYLSMFTFDYTNKGILQGTFVNAQGEELEVNLNAYFIIKYHGEAEIEGDTNVTKLVPFHKDNNYGVLLQYKIKANLENNNLPLDICEYLIEVPQINGVDPSDVDLMKIEKYNDGKIEYNRPLNGDWEYNEEENVITCEEINHPDKNSMMKWNKVNSNEYLVTVIYEGSEIFDYISNNEINLDLDLAFWVRITAYNDVETIREKWIRKSVHLNEIIGQLTDYTIINDANKLSKGYVYSNYVADEKTETEFNLKYLINVSHAQLIDEISIRQGNDKFIDKDENTYSYQFENKDYIYVKEISVDAALFKAILGENGTITVLDSNGEIGTITNEKNVLDCKNSNSNSITIRTSSPIDNGTLMINIKKAIKGENIFAEETFKKIETISNEISGNTGIEEIRTKSSIELTEPSSKAKITVEPEQLSTVIENKDVEIRAILDTSNINNSLYKNPTIRICFPKYIKQIKINSAMLLFEEELEVKTMKWETKETGKELLITLEGVQTKYNIGSALDGATIALVADITLDSLTPSKKVDLKIEVTNENIYDLTQLTEVDGVQVATTEEDAQMEYVGPTGVIATTSVSNYMDNAEEIMSMSSDKQTVTIKTGSAARTVSTKAKIINNYSDSISDVVILGRIPFKNNKQIDSSEDLGTTFDMTLKNKITVTGVETAKVYYSANGNATKDVENASNGWVEDPEDLSAIKSYLIIVEDEEIAAGSRIDFSYNAEIPANLHHNNNAYGTYKVYYDINESTGTHKGSKVSSIIGFTTGQGPDLKVELKSNMKNVRNGQIVKLTAVVENIGQVAAENVSVKINAPEGTVLVEIDTSSKLVEEVGQTKNFLISRIEPGEKIERQYNLKITTGTDESIEIENQVTVEITDEPEIESNKYVLNVAKGYLSISHGSNNDGSTALKIGDLVKFYVEVKNISNTTLENVTYTFDVPKVFDVKKVEFMSNISESITSNGVQIDNNKITINLGNMSSNELFLISIDTYVNQNKSEGDINVFSEAIATGTERHYSNEILYTMQSAEATISQVSLSDEIIKPGDEVNYKINVTTTDNNNVKSLKVTNQIPEELEFIKAEISNEHGKILETTTINDGKLEYSAIDHSGDLEITVWLKARDVQNEDTIEISNYSTLKYDGKEITSNTIKYYLEPGSQESIPNRYRISGTAWLDENKNGKRDEDEKLLSNMEVLLLYKNTNEIVLDEELNTEKRVTTDRNGKYQFLNIVPGEYYVVFLYEAGKYDITKYHMQNVDDALNCDVIEMETVIDGKNSHVGISDIIKVSNKNIRNIDIGLFMAEKFDLSLEKYVTKITLTTPTIGTKVYDYNNSKLAKIEILSQNVGQSDMIIEYKIVVKNEGAIPGYAKKIIDYMPKGTKFNSELNKDWFLANDGNLYCYSLADTVINSGETKELKLVLTCNLTESVIGSILNNNAEIYEAYNEKGTRDIDSIPNDKVQTEDDMSNADVALSISTGKMVTYTALILSIILFLILSTYIIKKFVLDVEN